MNDTEPKQRRPDETRSFPSTDVWPPKGIEDGKIEVDHLVFRKAPHISIAIGIAAGLAVAVFAQAPWWMPLLVFLVTAAMLYRILRPRVRHPSIEDEI